MRNLLSNDTKKLIFNVLGCIYLDNTEEKELTQESFVSAMTMNENLKTLGYSFNPSDIMKISKLKQFQNGNFDVYQLLKTFQPEISAKPMYPNFPSQVMAMDEVEFRFLQLMHYYSFALNESNEETKNIKAWLPTVTDTKKVKIDKTLLKAKTIALINKEGLKKELIKMIMKRERWTPLEIQFINQFIDLIKNEKHQIGFKENLTHIIYQTLINDNNTKKTKDLFECLAQNPNDILDCLEFTLSMKRGGRYCV